MNIVHLTYLLWIAEPIFIKIGIFIITFPRGLQVAVKLA